MKTGRREEQEGAERGAEERQGSEWGCAAGRDIFLLLGVENCLSIRGIMDHSLGWEGPSGDLL